MVRIRAIDNRDYYLGGIKLDRIDVEKDLGVLVSHNLSWNNHVDLISCLWNKLPLSIRESNTLSIFRQEFDGLLL